MESKTCLALLSLLLVCGVQCQNYCQSYVPTDRSCCTAFSIAFGVGVCCLIDGVCSCDLLRSPCAAAFNQQIPPTTAAPTAAPTQTPVPTQFPTTAPFVQTPTPAPVTPTVCPSVPSGRLLNSQLVLNVCDQRGVIGIYYDVSGRKVQFCNAVILYNSYTNYREIVMARECYAGITEIQKTYQVFAESQGVQFPFSTCNFEHVLERDDTTTVLIPDMVLRGFLDTLVSTCDNTACAFNTAVMAGQINPDVGCYLLSYGSTGPLVNSPGQYTSSGLRRANVVTVSSQNCSPLNPLPNEICLKLENSAGICQGDTSAALFCPLASTGEEVFIGFVNRATLCTGTLPSYAPVSVYTITVNSQR